MSDRTRVLVIGDDTRSFLSTVRSLGRKGLQVHAAPYGLSSPALHSRYIYKTHLLPYYLDGGAAWLDELKQLLVREQIDFVIPCEERSLLPLRKHRDDLPARCVLAIPDDRALEAFFDKAQTRRLAEAQGVPVCKGLELDSSTSAETVAKALRFPVVVKYKKSYTWPELYVRTNVVVLRSEGELALWLDRHRERLSEMFVEQMFDGIGIGVSVLCDQGQVVQAFEHHRAHELDGSSYYRKSAALNQARVDAVSRMVAAVRYTGLAMFEFKLNSTAQSWVLLEVNARPWGSLPLPVALGVDFPYRLYRLMVHGERVPACSYRVGIYGRNLISDIWQLRALMQRTGRGKASAVWELLKWGGGLGRVLIGHEFQDVLTRDDWRPGMVELRQFFRERWHALRPSPLPQKNLSAVSQLHRQDRPLHLIFVCQGNICRSPYAEHKARQLLEQAGLRVRVSSAGMLPRNRRPSPASAQDAAERRGVSLREHQSQHAHKDLLQSADMLLIFDTINYRHLLNRHPDLEARLYFLGQFSDPQAPVEIIEDPDGRGDAVFDANYAQIDRHLHALRDALRGV